MEGLLNNMLDEIEQNSLWGSGDGAAPDVAEKMKKFKVNELLVRNRRFRLGR